MTLSSASNFGNENVESSDLKKVADQQLATRAVLTEDGTVTSISAYVKGPTSKLLRYAVYSDSGGEPGSLIVESAVQFIQHSLGDKVPLARNMTYSPPGTLSSKRCSASSVRQLILEHRPVMFWPSIAERERPSPDQK